MYARLGFAESIDCEALTGKCPKEMKEWFRSNLKCLSPRLKKKLSGGHFSTTYFACCDDRCDYVAKIIPFREATDKLASYSVNDYHREIFYQQRVSRAGLAPKIVMTYRTKKYAVILMEKINGPLLYDLFDDILKQTYGPNVTESSKLPKDKQKVAHMTARLYSIAMLLNKAMHQLHLMGIVHQDTHAQNVIWDQVNNKFVFLDFMHAGDLGVGAPKKEQIETDHDYLLYKTGPIGHKTLPQTKEFRDLWTTFLNQEFMKNRIS